MPHVSIPPTLSALGSLGSTFARLALEIVGPSGCAACDARVGSTVLFCPVCASSVERADPPADRTVGLAAFEYGGAMATAIGRFKYEQRPDLGTRLGRAMLTVATALRGSVDVVIPVPLHPKRLAERGYNQAALLARPIASSLEIPFAPRALRRRHDTPRQVVLDREARQSNVRTAFATRERVRVAGSRVLLVDDVRTTGATLDACTSILRSAGARHVFALVLARRT